MRKEEGFSLIELMTVIGIVAVLATVAVPSYISWRGKQHLLRAADEVQTVIQLGKMAAIKENALVEVRLSPLDQSYEIFAKRNGVERRLRSGSLPPRVSLTSSFTQHRVIFDGRGLASAAGSVTLSHPEQGSKVVAVTVTGISRVQ